ncbi:DUF2326 domain-containing protein [Patescibacteria group bacterium]|nr:DUF2326 domain-containing protein [Patescibacteria group bacterium]
MKPILFDKGLNIVFGDVVNEVDKDGKFHEHNLGKTALVYLIDFLLLKKQSDFFKKNYLEFRDWTFFLEIKLNSGKYLTIRRSVNISSRVSFKLHEEKNQDFTNIDMDSWDYTEVSINTKSNEQNAVKILESYLNFNKLQDHNYRHFLKYILRKQDEYGDIFKMKSFKSKDRYWKPFLFDLFGGNGVLLLDKFELADDISHEERYIKRKSNENGVSDEKNIIQTIIDTKNKERESVQRKIDQFNFFAKEAGLNKDLIEDIEKNISDLNSRKYYVTYEKDKINESIESRESVDLKEIEKIFNEAKIYFPKELVNDYEDLISFERDITKEREKYLKEELVELENELESIQTKLIEYNEKRFFALETLKEKDTFVKFKIYQRDIIDIESEIKDYRNQLDNISDIKKLEEGVQQLKRKIEVIIDEIKNEVDKVLSGNEYREIQNIFSEIYKESMDDTAVIGINMNKENNVDFKTVTLNQAKLTGKGDGYTATRVQCVAFIVAILLYYSKYSYFNFCYLDGGLENWGDNPVKNFIKLFKRYSTQYDVQLIVSMIKSDVPQGFDIEKENIVRKLDKDDLLFGGKGF